MYEDNKNCTGRLLIPLIMLAFWFDLYKTWHIFWIIIFMYIYLNLLVLNRSTIIDLFLVIELMMASIFEKENSSRQILWWASRKVCLKIYGNIEHIETSLFYITSLLSSSSSLSITPCMYTLALYCNVMIIIMNWCW